MVIIIFFAFSFARHHLARLVCECLRELSSIITHHALASHHPIRWMMENLEQCSRQITEISRLVRKVELVRK